MIGGQAKTLMFVHISPEVNAVGETVSTLRFAERVASIELGATRFNKEIGEIQELKEEVKILNVQLQFFLIYFGCEIIFCFDKTLFNYYYFFKIKSVLDIKS